jgi:hypothetical protein
VFWTRFTTYFYDYEDLSRTDGSARQKDDVRIVVQSLAPGRTVVRVHSPVAEISAISSDRLNLLFNNIEVRLE